MNDRAGRDLVTRGRSSLAGYAVATAVVAATTLLRATMLRGLEDHDAALVYLLGVILVARRYGPVPAALAAVGSAGGFSVYSVSPGLASAPLEARQVVSFVLMLGVGLLVAAPSPPSRAESGGAGTGQERRDALHGLSSAAAARSADEGRIDAEGKRLRDALLSSVSHDLRTPLAAITGAASSLLQPASMSAATERELKESISAEADRLDRMITNMMDMARLSSGSVEPRREWEVLEEIVGAALARVSKGRDRGRVAVSIAPDFPLVLMDAVLMERVFVNLLENAFRRGHQGSAVHVDVRVEPRQIVVEVSDGGPGIPAERLPRIFESVFNEDLGDRRGFGLGLPTCSAIVTAHGGTIGVRGNAPTGATFWLTLPLDDEQPPMPIEQEASEPG